MPGETFKLRLELKLIADVGLVGYPNAGKSSRQRLRPEHIPRLPIIHLRHYFPILESWKLRNTVRFVLLIFPVLLPVPVMARAWV